ncbi:peptidase S9 family protein [candidate division KSB1 bacterium]|nr:MAG: peptidase S9 family protein [candidate division KSB1 bacterium]
MKKSILILVLSLILLSSICFGQSLYIKDILSVPFPSSLIAAPTGNRVAWVFNDRGKRNIWVADGPEYYPRQITHYDKDDGIEVGQLTFSPDGSTIVYVYNGSANRQGEFPNPTSAIKVIPQSVWAVKVDGGEPWLLGKGSYPAVSPAGDKVVFSIRGKIFISPIDSSQQAKLLFEARGRNSSYVWSPDGSKLAFVSYREDHSFIGIYDFKNQSIKWISPTVDRDSHPVWSPDGTHIAFIRIPGSMADPRRTRGGGYPFSFMVANVETGKARVVWSSPDSSGGFAQYYPAQSLFWAAGNRLVFYSEHEGWMHLYSVPVYRGKETCLTPGNYEVEYAVLSPDRKTIFFNSNKGDIDRRHLWSVSVYGGEPKQLTNGTGIEWNPVTPAEGDDLVFLCSTAKQPAAPAVIKRTGGTPRLIAKEVFPESFPMNELVTPEQVIIKAPDGFKIHCQLFLPKDAKPGDKRPAVIFMHGGPIRQMLLGWHYRGYYHNAYGMNQFLCSNGYVVLSVNYRSGIGYGRGFREAPNQGPRGASEYQDIVAAGKYLQSRPEVDPRKIGLWGGSYGGYLTALGLARDSELFAAGVDLHGVHDWSLRARRRNGGGWGIYGDELMLMAYKSSPVADVQFWYSPCLFIHGDDDRNVDFIQTTDLVQRLRKEGKAHIETLIYPDEVHGFLRHNRWIQTYNEAKRFFDRFLKFRRFEK